MCGIFRDRTKTAAVHKSGLITQRDPRREPDAMVEGETSSAIAAVPQASSTRSVMTTIMPGPIPHGSPTS
jgi:hypothetical protein